ncbi:LOW QUALITY PROTEIN: hypothetical protein SORBI_3007G023900 [Sorghum bicolor]|uniref:Uncharacterized protein n=1 Tax=Sorghum bicolor TaxID=4558 RepID=A0A1B6PF61_SORBI|nr:LOW QUALITY PROTEIN: hypothetical protein SORBI_3007G023900 [Sorghum bicolor]
MDTSRTILIRENSTHEVVLAIDERTALANERLKAEFYKVDTKIHRFPRSLQGIGGDNDRYIVPSVVAIGPYHHGSPHLQKMEEVKLAAAYHLCRHSGRSSSSMEVYEKILSVVDDARGSYDVKDPSVFGLSNHEFAAMMFLDGCFLLQYMIGGGDVPVLQNWMTPSIERDIFLLENQIPWLVLEVLIEFMPVDVLRFVRGVQEKFHPGKAKEKKVRPLPDDDDRGVGGRGDYKPPHLLGLLWYILQIHSMPERVQNYSYRPRPLKSSNAVELAEIGIRLAPSTKPWFWDMSFRRGRLFAVSLSPVLLNDTTACWLVNLAALEEANTSAGSGATGEYYDKYVVSSYLFMLAMLMDREEEVQQMRSKYILYSTLSNKQALSFFKDLADHLRFGDPYLFTLIEIWSYRRQLLITIYRFIYKNYRAIAAVLSIAGVLCSILNALYSLKKPYKT